MHPILLRGLDALIVSCELVGICMHLRIEIAGAHSAVADKLAESVMVAELRTACRSVVDLAACTRRSRSSRSAWAALSVLREVSSSAFALAMASAER